MLVKRKILVVEDSSVNRQILCKILGAEYQTVEAENGLVALNYLRTHFDELSLVLLDIEMPVMNGREFLQAVQGDEKLRSVPVIVATQYTSESFEVSALKLGAVDFVTKPYNPEIILNRIAAIIKLRESAALVNAIQFDSVTDVFSKEYFYDQAKRLIDANPETGYKIICSDIDNFKLVNDMFGIRTGDALLRFVAEMLRKHAGDEGLCGRIGADVFVAIVPMTFDIRVRLPLILEELKAFPIRHKIVMRFGVYDITDRELPVSMMCDRANIAVKSIKNKYGEIVADYDDELRQKLLAEQRILDGMDKALEERQFVVYFQPKYNLKNEKICGAEALVRWNHPTLGFIYPMEFVPMFEKNGFIVRLDLYVWEEACRFLTDLRLRGKPVVPVSVNVSRMDIYHEDLPERITELVDRYKIDHSYFHLEITEGAYTESPKQIVEVVSELRRRGFPVEMDDFGTGYSSLSMLSDLPIDLLKLDMRFIHDEYNTAAERNILSFIISLSKWLGLPVIAEGVETPEQVARLKQLECSGAQGYFYSQPVSEEEFGDLLTEGTVDATMRVKKSMREVETTSRAKGAKTMMIVDDKNSNREMLRDIFSDRYKIVEADNGLSAFDYLLEHTSEVEVVLLDMMMPVMDGYQFMERVAENQTLSEIPIVVVAAQSGNEERALELGAANFVTAPFNPRILRHQIRCAVALAKLKKQEREVTQKAELLNEAYHDPLTGLLNRRGFEKAVEDLGKKRGCGLNAVCMIDVDNLKENNDMFGHFVGDKVLECVADTLTRETRAGDVIARIGGDEFLAILLDMPNEDSIETKASALCEHLKRETVSGGRIRVSCSVGARAWNGIDNIDDVLVKADKALYVAKGNGKGCYFVDVEK